MKVIEKDQLETVQGGSVFSLSVGLLLGAMAVRGYDAYLEYQEGQEQEEEEEASIDPELKVEELVN